MPFQKTTMILVAALLAGCAGQTNDYDPEHAAQVRYLEFADKCDGAVSFERRGWVSGKCRFGDCGPDIDDKLICH